MHAIGELAREEVCVLHKLSGFAGKELEPVPEIRWDTFGYQAEGGRVVGLGLYRGGLSELPEDLAALSELRTLNLAYNDLRTISEEVCALKNLEYLSCIKNQIIEIPRAISSLSNLRFGLFGSNRLGDIPDTIGDLPRIEYLDLNNNFLHQLPETLCNLKSLRELNIGSNRKMTLSEPNIYRESGLRHFVFTSEDAPRTPFELQNHIVGTTFNQLEQLPASIGSLINLEKLSVVSNRLSVLPDSICKIASLRELDLGHNRLRELPEDLGRRQSLELVDLSWNELSVVPAALRMCPTIRQLRLVGNPIDAAGSVKLGLQPAATSAPSIARAPLD